MKQLIAVLTAVVAAVLAPAALAGNDHRTLGPAGYDTPGKSALVLAGSGGVELGSGDHVVICHAIGGAQGDRFNQIAPSASGVLHGHDGHEGDRDIIPPYIYVDHKGGKDASLAGGNNWSGANIELYENGCRAREPQAVPPGRDECPNIVGNQNSVPTGLIKDASGNCVDPPRQPTDVCPNIEGIQTSVPAGFVKDTSGNCVCPPVTVTVNVAPPAAPQAVKQPTAITTPVVQGAQLAAPAAPKAKPAKKAKRAKQAKKAKKAKRLKAKKAKRKTKRVKSLRAAALPRRLPFTP
jgi:hypothetical protein